MFATGDSVKENFFDINSCRNIVTVAKENAANLKSVVSYDIEQGKHFGSLYGDSYCNNKDKPCLRNLYRQFMQQPHECFLCFMELIIYQIRALFIVR